MSNSIKIEKDIKDGVLVGVQVIEETENSTSHHYIFSDLPETATDEEIAVVMTEKLGFNPFEQSKIKWRQSASLSRRRFKIGEALYQVNGTPLVQLIEALLAGLTEPTKTVATIAYNESGNFDRLDPFILQFSGALGMSEEETDAFFKYCINEGWNQ